MTKRLSFQGKYLISFRNLSTKVCLNPNQCGLFRSKTQKAISWSFLVQISKFLFEQKRHTIFHLNLTCWLSNIHRFAIKGGSPRARIYHHPLPYWLVKKVMNREMTSWPLKIALKVPKNAWATEDTNSVVFVQKSFSRCAWKGNLIILKRNKKVEKTLV